MTEKINNVRISLRLPPALHKRLREQAQDACRSLHGQIVWLLENTTAARDAAGHRAGERATQRANAVMSWDC
jgi:hypothetical protein